MSRPVSAFVAADELAEGLDALVKKYREARKAPLLSDPWALSADDLNGTIVTVKGEVIFRPEGDRRQAAALAVRLVNLYFAGAGMGPEVTGLTPFEAAAAQVIVAVMKENEQLKDAIQ